MNKTLMEEIKELLGKHGMNLKDLSNLLESGVDEKLLKPYMLTSSDIRDETNTLPSSVIMLEYIDEETFKLFNMKDYSVEINDKIYIPAFSLQYQQTKEGVQDMFLFNITMDEPED